MLFLTLNLLKRGAHGGERALFVQYINVAGETSGYNCKRKQRSFPRVFDDDEIGDDHVDVVDNM